MRRGACVRIKRQRCLLVFSNCSRGRFPNWSGSLGYHAIAVSEFGFERQAPDIEITGKKTVHIQRRTSTQHVLRLGKNVVYIGRGNDANRDLPINPSEREVVDLIAEGRNV